MYKPLRKYDMATHILNEVHFELEKSVLLKDDFQAEIVFFDILTNTISCGWCKLVDSSLILFIKTL